MNTHAETRKNIFLLGGKNYDTCSLFHFSSPFIPQDKSQLFNPRHHFHLICSLSHHFPSFLVPTLMPSPHSYSFSFFFYFRQHLVSQLQCSSCALAPSYFPSFMSAFAIIFVLEIKLSYFSVQTHTCTLCHAPAEEFTSHLLPLSPLSSSDPCLSPLFLLLLALSLLLLLSSLL